MVVSVETERITKKGDRLVILFSSWRLPAVSARLLNE